MSKPLDKRQVALLKNLAKEVSDDIETKPFEDAANLCEGLAIMLEMIGAEVAASTAFHLVRFLREGKKAHGDLTRQLAQLLAAEPTAGEGKQP